MNELSLVIAANQPRSPVPAIASVAGHIVVVGALVLLASITTTLPKVPPSAVVPIFNEPFRADTPEPPKPPKPPAPDKVVVGGFAAAVETVQTQAGKVEIGAFNRSTSETEPGPKNSDSGKVILGGLSGGTAGGKQPGPAGVVGPTDVFNPSGPGTNPGPVGSQHAGNEPAQLLSVPAPSYSEEARRLNLTGVVVLQVKLSASGEVHFLRVLSGLGHGLDEAAIVAVNQTRCKPALQAGHPVDVIATIRVIFRLT